MKWSEVEVPDHYGDPLGEHRATRTQSGLIDQSPRGKLSLKGTDRVEFLNGMVTNDVKNLEPGQGCYAAFTTLKAKILSDCRIYSLPDSLLLDLEVGIINKIQEHLDRYIIASDVTMEDLTNKWGLLSIYGPESSSVLSKLLGTADLPEGDCSSRETKYKSMDLLCVRNHITGEIGYDLYIPAEGILTIFQEVKAAGVSLVGWRALETLRIEAGIPRYGLDMDESHFPMEAGLTQRAISETKGCYIGQETIARAMAQGQMNRFLVGLEVEGEVPPKNNEA